MGAWWKELFPFVLLNAQHDRHKAAQISDFATVLPWTKSSMADAAPISDARLVYVKGKLS